MKWVKSSWSRRRKWRLIIARLSCRVALTSIQSNLSNLSPTLVRLERISRRLFIQSIKKRAKKQEAASSSESVGSAASETDGFPGFRVGWLPHKTLTPKMRRGRPFFSPFRPVYLSDLPPNMSGNVRPKNSPENFAVYIVRISKRFRTHSLRHSPHSWACFASTNPYWKSISVVYEVIRSFFSSFFLSFSLICFSFRSLSSFCRRKCRRDALWAPLST